MAGGSDGRIGGWVGKEEGQGRWAGEVGEAAAGRGNRLRRDGVAGGSDGRIGGWVGKEERNRKLSLCHHSAGRSAVDSAGSALYVRQGEHKGK